MKKQVRRERDRKNFGIKKNGEGWEDEQTQHFKYAALRSSKRAETNV